jgi:hypothetical protein
MEGGNLKNNKKKHTRPQIYRGGLIKRRMKRAPSTW